MTRRPLVLLLCLEFVLGCVITVLYKGEAYSKNTETTAPGDGLPSLGHCSRLCGSQWPLATLTF